MSDTKSVIKTKKVVKEKTLSNVDTQSASTNVSDIQVEGDPNAWVCIAKAWSKKEGWMKSTKVMPVAGGVLVQVSTQQGSQVAEALTFIPDGALLQDKKTGKYKLGSQSNFKAVSRTHRIVE